MSGVSPLASAALWLDQPRLVYGLTRAVPWALPVLGAAAAIEDARRAPQPCRSAAMIRDGAAMAGTVIAALIGAKRFIAPASLQGLKAGIAQVQRELPASASASTRELLALAQRRMLSPRQVHRLRTDLLAAGATPQQGRDWMDRIIPRPQGVTGKEILGEIKDLSLLGLLPVLGGLAGGVVGNAMTGENCRRRLKNQAQEASFQYLANIVLCNIGAGAALSALERTPLRHHRGARLGALIGGITAVGVLGGSAIANFIGKNLLGPMLEEGPIGGLRATVGRVRTEGVASLWRGLNDQRHIEATDVALHADDFAVAGVFAGLKWITPLLALLYTVSGYRAGVGYRNGAPPAPAMTRGASPFAQSPVFKPFYQQARVL